MILFISRIKFVFIGIVLCQQKKTRSIVFVQFQSSRHILPHLIFIAKCQINTGSQIITCRKVHIIEIASSDSSTYRSHSITIHTMIICEISFPVMSHSIIWMFFDFLTKVFCGQCLIIFDNLHRTAIVVACGVIY